MKLLVLMIEKEFHKMIAVIQLRRYDTANSEECVSELTSFKSLSAYVEIQEK